MQTENSICEKMRKQGNKLFGRRQQNEKIDLVSFIWTKTDP